MKHLPKSTPTEILNDPYGFTYKEMSDVFVKWKVTQKVTQKVSSVNAGKK